jgi:hypothetical protein
VLLVLLVLLLQQTQLLGGVTIHQHGTLAAAMQLVERGLAANTVFKPPAAAAAPPGMCQPAAAAAAYEVLYVMTVYCFWQISR